MGTTRRELLALLAASGCLARRARGQEPAPDAKPAAEGLAEAPLPKRVLGSTGRELPLLGLGCAPLGELATDDEAVALVRRALESGARYFDTAPSYAVGVSERRLGLGLKDFAREKLYVATKTLERDGEAALAELERSLERLQLDFVDCVQVHEVRSAEDLEAALGPKGVVKALEAAREKKKLRHIGVTGHRDPAVLIQALERYEFASALVPVNPLDLQHRSFIKLFLPVAVARGTAVVAMKVYAGGALLGPDSKVSAVDLVRFALAQPGVVVAVPGASTLAHWEEARWAATQPLPDAAEQARIAAAVGSNEAGRSEWYKQK